LTGVFCDKQLVEGLWQAKGRLDALWALPPPPMARSLMNRVARAQLFPHSGEGGSKENGENRAGDKLAELADLTGLLHGVPAGCAFLDLCGGPGAWSQFLLAQRDLSLRGFGLTLRAQVGSERDWHAQEKDEWYPELSKRSDWAALWGKDGSGDLLKPGNLEHACRQLDAERVMLCVADGGFSDDSIPANLLELYFYRLFLGELLMAVRVLQPGGRFVCKLYGSCSQHTAALLYCATRLFDDVSIVKPKTSKATGPERYLAAFGRKTGKEAAQIREALSRAHAFGGASSPLEMPLLTPVVTMANLAADGVFTSSVAAMTSKLCNRNVKALNAVVDRAEFLEEMAKTVNDEMCKRSETQTIQCWPKCRDETHEAPEPASALPANFGGEDAAVAVRMSGIDKTATDTDIVEFFAEVQVKTTGVRQFDVPKHNARVDFGSKEDLERALAMNGRNLLRRKVKVELWHELGNEGPTDAIGGARPLKDSSLQKKVERKERPRQSRRAFVGGA